MLSRGSSGVPDVPNPMPGEMQSGTDHLGTLPSVFNTTGLYRQHHSYAHTAAASHY